MVDKTAAADVLIVDWIVDVESQETLDDAWEVRREVQEAEFGESNGVADETENGFGQVYDAQYVDRDENHDAIGHTNLFPAEDYVERDVVRAGVAIERIREELKQKREEFKRAEEAAAQGSGSHSTGDGRRLRDKVKNGFAFFGSRKDNEVRFILRVFGVQK